jgi:hypothetical protein
MKLFIFGLLFLIAVYANAFREVGNGAGGVIDSNGRYSTFYSANIPVLGTPLEAAEIPGMETLINNIASLEIPGLSKGFLLSEIYPSGGRSYYKVDKDKFDDIFQKKLAQKYADLMNVPADQVVLFGITDPASQTTFLLPSFFELTEVQQAAVLFHESLWVAYKDTSYEMMVVTEQAAQAYFQDPGNDTNFYNFYYQLSVISQDRLLPIKAFLKREASKGFAWAPQKNQSSILLKDLLGEKFIKCSIAVRNSGEFMGYENCTKSLLGDLIIRSQKMPTSLLVKYLIDFIKIEKSYLMLTPDKYKTSCPGSDCDYFIDNASIDLLSLDQQAADSEFNVSDSKGVIGRLIFRDGVLLGPKRNQHARGSSQLESDSGSLDVICFNFVKSLLKWI